MMTKAASTSKVDVILPDFLKPRLCESLIRLGNVNDGGYLVNSRDINISTGLLSFGVCDDWSFESEFYEKKSVPIYAFDGSISLNFWIKKVLSAISTRRFFKVLDYFRFKKFFKGDKYFIPSFIGYSGISGYLSLQEALHKIKGSDEKVFLKIDIEGWEYRILNDVIENAEKLSGVVIEFHNIDLHMDRISSFVTNFPLNVVHVHANNCSSLSPDGLALCIEVTFSSSAESHQFGTLPNVLDSPNNPGKNDYHISLT